MSIITKRPRAVSDLADIWDYIADDSEERADAFIETIDGKLKTLAGSPKIGRTRDELMKGIRSWSIGRYVVFYFPLENGVEIIRVLHGSRDIASVFFEDDI